MDGGIQDAKISIEKNLDSNLPLVSVDPQQILQVLVNLILNSVQAMPSGGKLMLSTHVKNGKVDMIIADNGVGIQKDKLKKIFKPFFTTKPKGTGLGLSICNTIVQNHSGNLEVESSAEKGTTFTIILPLI